MNRKIKTKEKDLIFIVRLFKKNCNLLVVAEILMFLFKIISKKKGIISKLTFRSRQSCCCCKYILLKYFMEILFTTNNEKSMQ